MAPFRRYLLASARNCATGQTRSPCRACTTRDRTETTRRFRRCLLIYPLKVGSMPATGKIPAEHSRVVSVTADGYPMAWLCQGSPLVQYPAILIQPSSSRATDSNDGLLESRTHFQATDSDDGLLESRTHFQAMWKC